MKKKDPYQKEKEAYIAAMVGAAGLALVAFLYGLYLYFKG